MKNKLRLLTLMVPIAMLSMVSAGFASVNDPDASGESEEPYPYISPTPGEFPIIAWGLYYDTSHTIFKDLMDCGFNAAIVDGGSHCQALIQALNPVAGQDTVKVKLIPWFNWFVVNKEPEQMPGYMDGILNDYRKYAKPGNKTPITGWMLTDEPKYYQFDYYKPYFHAMAQHDTTRMTWTNLIGDTKAKQFLYYDPTGSIDSDTVHPVAGPRKASIGQWTYVTLKKYIDDFCSKFRPGVLSYDYYPFTVKQDTTCVPHKLVDSTIEQGRLGVFYTALQLYSYTSKRIDRPFWAFCQCRATCTDSEYKLQPGHPAPTEDYLRYEAFNALAFGAQGIQYWNYKEAFDRPVNDDGSYYAPVTKDGKKTPAWYFVQNVNREIRQLTHVFLGARLESYYFVGDPRITVYSDYKPGTDADPVFVQSTDSRANSKGSNLGALVSTLVNGKDHYVVIVNQSPYEQAELLLKFNTLNYKIERLQPRGDALVSHPVGQWTIQGSVQTVSLPRAQYMVYRYEPRLPSLPNPNQ